MNPGYAIELWISQEIINAEAYAKFQIFCAENRIQLRDVSELTCFMAPHVRDWFQASLLRSDRNYGALIDINRPYLLLKTGGWYVDTDRTPRSLPMNLESRYGLVLDAFSKNNQCAVYPHEIAVSPLSHFALKSIEIIEALTCTQQVATLNQMLHTASPSECWMATEQSTGLISYIACSKLTNERNQPLISFEYIEPSIQFSHVLKDQKDFWVTHQREFSWIKSRSLNQARVTLYPDPRYCDKINQWTLTATLCINTDYAIRIIEYIPIQLSMFWSSLAKIAQCKEIQSENTLKLGIS